MFSCIQHVQHYTLRLTFTDGITAELDFAGKVYGRINPSAATQKLLKTACRPLFNRLQPVSLASGGFEPAGANPSARTPRPTPRI